MTEKPPLDPRTLKTLRRLSGPDDPDLHLRLVRKYLESSRNVLSRIGAAADEGATAALEAAAHELRGSSGNVGALVLFERCGALEEAAAEGRVDRSSIGAVESEFRRVAAALEAEFGL